MGEITISRFMVILINRRLTVSIVMFINEVLSPADIIRSLGERFRDYRMRLNMTQQQVSDFTAISVPTIYKFENGNATDMSLSTLLKLLRAIDQENNWSKLLPQLPESPYTYRENKKKQRIRNSRK